MRYLAVDLGTKRTGLATGDSVLKLVQPLEVLQVARGPALLDAIARAVKDVGPDAIVLGLPLNMDGTEGAASRDARAFAQTLAARVNLPVHLQDERLTSFDAEQRMAQSGRTHKAKRELRDALAACAVLEDYLGADGRGSPEMGT